MGKVPLINKYSKWTFIIIRLLSFISGTFYLSNSTFIKLTIQIMEIKILEIHFMRVPCNKKSGILTCNETKDDLWKNALYKINVYFFVLFNKLYWLVLKKLKISFECFDVLIYSE